MIDSIIKNIGILFALSICFATSGCTSWYRAVDRNQNEPLNLRRPDILPGQVAYINAGDYVVQAMRATGLFKSVESTTSRSPTPTGIYMAVQGTSYEGKNSGFIGTFLQFMTLGLIADPACRTYDHYFDVTLYQNGALILNTTLSTTHQMECGWAALFDDSNQLYQDEANIIVNRMISSLNKQSK